MPTPPPQQPPGTRPHAPGQPPASPGNGRPEPDCPCPPGGARPLPDPAALRLLRVPDSAPPYDAPGSGGTESAAGWCQGEDSPASPGNGWAAGGQWPARRDREATAAPGSPVPAGCTDTDGSAGHGGHRDADGSAGHGGHPDPDGNTGHGGHPDPHGSTGPGNGPDPGRWPGQFAQALAETLAGSRPPRQIVPWTTERARTHIRRLGAQLSLGQQPRVRRVVTCRPRQDVVEMTVIVGCGPHVRALAVRLERAEAAAGRPGRPARTARWLCTAVEAA